MGRALCRKATLERARDVLEKALSLSPTLRALNYFYARVLRSDGNYEELRPACASCLASIPRDRVALNDSATFCFCGANIKKR